MNAVIPNSTGSWWIGQELLVLERQWVQRSGSADSKPDLRWIHTCRTGVLCLIGGGLEPSPGSATDHLAQLRMTPRTGSVEGLGSGLQASILKDAVVCRLQCNTRR